MRVVVHSFVLVRHMAAGCPGCGFLGVPWAFNRVGIVFGSVFMVALTYLCLMTVSYILDGMKCAEALTRAKLDPIAHSSRPEYMVSGRKFELVELVEMFLVRSRLRRCVWVCEFHMVLIGWWACSSGPSCQADLYLHHHPVPVGCHVELHGCLRVVLFKPRPRRFH